MSKLGHIYIIIFILLVTSMQAADLSFLIKPNLTSVLPQIEVEMEISTDVNGEAYLIYYNDAWGETDLFNALASVRCMSHEIEVIRMPEKNSILLKGPANERLRIEYVIRQDFRGEANLDHYYRPIINHKYFHLFGHRLFLIPEEIFATNKSRDIEIMWEDSTQFVQHNLGKLKNGVYNLKRNELLESVVVGGDFRKQSINIDGTELRLLTRGNWKNFDDVELLEKIQSIVKVQSAFWNDYTDDIYTVTLLPLHSQLGKEIGGTGLAKGFASYCTSREKPSIENLTALYYHEIMHHWIGGKIRNVSQSGELWFSEGFTEYFSQLLMLEEGEISNREFEQKLKRTQKELTTSSAHGLANSDIRLNSKYEKIPYMRGFVYANYLDKEIQSNGDGRLADLMHRILRESSEIGFSNAYFSSLLLEIIGPKAVQDFDNYILQGKKIP